MKLITNFAVISWFWQLEPEIKDFHFLVKGIYTVFENVSMTSKTKHQEAGNL